MTQTKKIRIEEKKRVQSNFLLSLWAAITKKECEGLKQEQEKNLNQQFGKDSNTHKTTAPKSTAITSPSIQKKRSDQPLKGELNLKFKTSINDDNGSNDSGGPIEFRHSQK